MGDRQGRWTRKGTGSLSGKAAASRAEQRAGPWQSWGLAAFCFQEHRLGRLGRKCVLQRGEAVEKWAQSSLSKVKSRPRVLAEGEESLQRGEGEEGAVSLRAQRGRGWAERGGGRAAEAPGEAEKAQSCACGTRRAPESCFSLPCLLPPLLTSFRSTGSRIPTQTVGGWRWSRGLTETTGRRIPSGCTQLW